MKVAFNAFTRLWKDVEKEAMSAFNRVGESGWYVLGKEVGEFEKQLASAWKLPYAVGCANGLDAIEIGLRVLGLKSGDKVLTTPLSAFATTLAIVRAGGVPVFIDVDSTGLIDLNIAKKILEEDSSIKFFVPVHLYGHCLNLESLNQLKKEFDLKIVEDCAQSILASSSGIPCGSIGQVATTSFYPTKNLGCLGDGGAALCHDIQIYESIKSLRDYGQIAKYKHANIGLNSRLDELQAAYLLSLLPLLDKATQRRISTATRYKSEILNPLIVLPPVPDGSESVWHLFPTLTKERDEFQNYLKHNGIETAIHYPGLISDQEALSEVNSIVVGELYNSKLFASQELSLPIHPYLTDDEVNYVIKICNQWRQ